MKVESRPDICKIFLPISATMKKILTERRRYYLKMTFSCRDHLLHFMLVWPLITQD